MSQGLGTGITKYLDVAKAHRPEREQRRVHVDFPIRLIHSLDREAKRLGVPRRSTIEVRLAERLEKMKAWREVFAAVRGARCDLAPISSSRS